MIAVNVTLFRERDYLGYDSKEIQPEVAIVIGTHPLH